MRARRLGKIVLASALGAGLSAAAPSGAQGEPEPMVQAMSVGSPTDGTLVGGAMLRERAELRLRWPDGPRWGLPSLIGMLERAARRVDRKFPGSVLLVGDLSRREGGALSGHQSHASGRDADVAFYYVDTEGHVVRTDRLLPVRPSGTVGPEARLRFDESRNWALVEALLTDAEVVVQKIFVADPLKRRLLAYAREHRTGGSVLERAEVALRQPQGGAPHDDHFHVRIACPRGQTPLCIPEPLAPSARVARTASLGPIPGR